MNELEQWVSSGWLKRHTPTAEETAELLGVADRDLADCAAAGLSKDWRFGIAYNAALQLAHAVLAAAGYETPKGESHHYRAIQSLAHTIGADAPFLRRFEAFRKKRNAGVYERAGLIAPDEADAIWSRWQRASVDAWSNGSRQITRSCFREPAVIGAACRAARAGSVLHHSITPRL